MYQALYRKWRPRTFDEVYGQLQVTRTLINELETDRISHAYLFTGSRGTGKTSCAKILSKAVNCLHRVNGNPCNECEICRGIDSGAIMDVIEIDAASNNSVDNIRDLREEVNFTPANAKYRVYIIDEVHMLSAGAFNALLKTLEEPPSHVIFILATTDVYKLPATILSRCQRFDFKRISPEDIIARLKYVAEHEGVTITESAANLIANIAEGGMRDSLSLMDRCLSISNNIDEDTVSSAAGIAGTKYMFEFSGYIANSMFKEALMLISKLHSESCDIESLCSGLISHFRNLMVAKTVNNCSGLIICSAEEMQKYKSEAEKLKLRKILDCIEILDAAAKTIKTVTNKKIQLEAAIIKMCGISNAGEASVPQQVYTESASHCETPSLPDTAVKDQASASPSVPSGIPTKPVNVPYNPENIKDGAFSEWPDVLERIKAYDMPLFGLMCTSTASIKDGKVIIKTDNPTLYDYIVNDETKTHYRDLLKSIYDVIGIKMKITINNIRNDQSSIKDNSPLSNLAKRIKDFNDDE